MKVINLHGVVGVHINAADFANELNNSKGNITLDLNSGGGYITEGIAIMNSMKNYTKGKIVARVSFAASMMTQIALAADEVQVYDNSIFMIHNALGVAMGDYRDMEKRRNILKSMSNMLAKTYVNKTGKSTEKILKMMDEETYLYGNEIVKEGFADTMLDTPSEENNTKDEAVAYAHIQMVEVNEALKAENISMDELAACIGNCGLNLEYENATPAFKDYPIVDQSWDGAAAVRRVRRFLNAEDAPNDRYKEAFFWYNTEASENFGSYKLPFVDVVDGRLVANIRGVNAANGAMAGARGQRVDIPNADRPRVQSHIDRYREKWQKEQEKGEGGSALGSNSAESGKQYNKGTSMDLNQLRTEHPEVFAAAVQTGVDQERERVTAHLTMGEASGDMELAIMCVNDGSGMSATINAKYMAAQMKRVEIGNRAGEQVPPVNTPEQNLSEDETMARAVGEILGVDHE